MTSQWMSGRARGGETGPYRTDVSKCWAGVGLQRHLGTFFKSVAFKLHYHSRFILVSPAVWVFLFCFQSSPVIVIGTTSFENLSFKVFLKAEWENLDFEEVLSTTIYLLVGNLLLGNVFLSCQKGIFNISSFLPPRV